MLQKYALVELYVSLDGNIHQRPYVAFILYRSQSSEAVFQPTCGIQLPPCAFPTTKWIIQVKTFTVCCPIPTELCPDVRAQHWRMLKQQTSRTPFKGVCKPHQLYQDMC